MPPKCENQAVIRIFLERGQIKLAPLDYDFEHVFQ